MKKVCALALSILTTIGATAADSAWAAQTSVHLYNWYDFIAPETPKAFQKETGTRVVLDTFDSAETAQGKLMVGRSGYDVVVITSNILPGLIKAGVLQELDRDRLPHWKNLDADILGKLQANDPGNRYAVPYLWGTTGIAYDVDKVRKLLGPDAPVDSWDLVFKEENISRLSQCGVATLDSSTELVSIALNYLGLPHNSQNPEDYQKAQELLLKVRPYIRYFDSSRVDTDLSNGNVCVVVGWQGTAYMGQVNNEQAGNGRHIAYSIPREGSLVWAENMVLLKDAPHPQQGYALIDYLLRPEVIARTSNYVGYPNGNQAALPLVERKLRENPAVYLSKETMATLFPLETLPLKVERIRTRVWSRVKTGS
ncbi:TPA: polyamine ABC transporter substrate-binding protein [Pseudomonas aeruginosa]|nr:polyamine ABC transporter substrate-binding protein [Pseudomonas aeruginosa]